MQFALSTYDLLLPPGIEWLKLLYILPDDNKRSYILKQNLLLKVFGFFKYVRPFVTNKH